MTMFVRWALLVGLVRLLWMGCGCREQAKQVSPPPDAPQPPDPPAK